MPGPSLPHGCARRPGPDQPSYSVVVPSSLLLLIAALIGLVIGCSSTWALIRSERRRALSFSATPDPQVVPEAAAEVLAILSSAYVVLDSSGDVLRASPLAYSYGIEIGRASCREGV